MVLQLLPWFALTAVTGLVIGLILGFWMASALVREHYAHRMYKMRAAPRSPRGCYEDA
jgi:hypothetical protein